MNSCDEPQTVLPMSPCRRSYTGGLKAIGRGVRGHEAYPSLLTFRAAYESKDIRDYPGGVQDPQYNKEQFVKTRFPGEPVGKGSAGAYVKISTEQDDNHESRQER